METGKYTLEIMSRDGLITFRTAYFDTIKEAKYIIKVMKIDLPYELFRTACGTTIIKKGFK